MVVPGPPVISVTSIGLVSVTEVGSSMAMGLMIGAAGLFMASIVMGYAFLDVLSVCHAHAHVTLVLAVSMRLMSCIGVS